ncbi:hypothetical protein EJB05_05621, partial [Eragrostis curvula]
MEWGSNFYWISQHDTTESSGSEKPAGCEKTARMTATSSSSDMSGKGGSSKSESFESDDLEIPAGIDYVISSRSGLSEAQKERVIAFIHEIEPEVTVFVAILRKSHVQPPSPFLAITKEYVFTHFPRETTNVTLERPGSSKKWHPKFYQRKDSVYLLRGEWLDFVRDNHVHEGDICLLLPTKGARKFTFTVHLLSAKATDSLGGTVFRRVGPYPGRSNNAEMASEVHIKEEPTDGEHAWNECLENKCFGCPYQPPYIVPAGNHLSQSQKKIVVKKVQAIQSELPIYVAFMSKISVGDPRRSMLELGSRYAAAVHLPARGQTVVLKYMRKIWETKMVSHGSRRQFLCGGWYKFVRDNSLRVGDICLLELKKNERKLTMEGTVCEVCGNIGFKHLLLCCRVCKSSATHQYCLDKVIFDASLADWLCHECLQRHGEVTCSRSLEKVSSERPLNYPHFGSTVHQPITKRVESGRDSRPCHDSQTNEHASVICKSVEVNSAKDIKTMVGAHKNKDVLMLEREEEEVEVQQVCNASNELQQRTMAVNFLDISSSSQHDRSESLKSSEISIDQNGNSYHHEKIVKMAGTFLSSQESGEDSPSENESLESGNLQASPGVDYVVSRTSYLTEAQTERVIAFIQKTKPEITVFVAVMRKSNIQPPGPCLGISKEYALAHFPHTSKNVTLQMPGKSKKWHPIFYKRDESRKNMLMGQWLDFVRDNHVHEGDICFLSPEKGGGRSTFTVYLLRSTLAHSRCGAGFQRDGPCPGGSIANISEVHMMEKQNDEQHISSESGMHESSRGSLECEVSDDPSQPPYIVPCRSHLSKSPKRIVEQKVRAIKSEVPICVAVMKNNNVGVAQRWMLELGSRFASVHLPAEGQTVVLQCGRKIWETKMMYHTGRRWTLNGGWPNFARDNGLRVGDICLFELKKNEMKLTMRVPCGVFLYNACFVLCKWTMVVANLWAEAGFSGQVSCTIYPENYMCCVHDMVVSSKQLTGDNERIKG